MEKIIYKWELPKDHPNFTGYDDLPTAYRVIKDKEAACGIIVEAKYHGRWTVNPWNMRSLVKHLIDKTSDIKQALIELRDKYLDESYSYLHTQSRNICTKHVEDLDQLITQLEE